ncbi:MAG: type II toxin-antitoxin system VapC family toxin [Mesorhizobium sp.]|nr:type II toxin-antitoxin system VapC family toxin [Mesorhizobium sp.]
MFIDASALIALLTDEIDAPDLLERLQNANLRVTSPLSVWEAAIAVGRILNIPIAEASQALRDYLKLMDIELAAIPPPLGYAALAAYDRYGKGRHPARLNFGDCFSYSCAKHFDLPLLFKGDDFTKTDIRAA